ncbi:MAG: hypothetical protein GY794_15270 [bacterium]|nr:hypothetical protein [bacterium]
MIYTFYSYKGGVGRTMALANVAELFRRRGKRVLMIDWDLEAPGLEQFFFQGEKLEELRDRPGIMELLQDYKRQMTGPLDLSDRERWPFKKPQDSALRLKADSSSSGELWLLTPGRRSAAHFSAYTQAVLNFNWQDFYENWAGEGYFDWFRRQCKSFADLILIDSRTGVTEMGGVCTYHLADIVVLLCAANNQNIQGTLKMVEKLSHEGLQSMRGGRPLKTMVLPSRIDIGGETAQRTRLRERLAVLGESRKESSIFDEDLLIPYVSTYSFEEQLAVSHGKESSFHSPELNEAYDRLSHYLEDLAGELRQGWKQKIKGLTKEWEDYGRQKVSLLRARTLEPRPEEKQRLSDEMDAVEQARTAIEETSRQLEQEFQYYLR